MFTKLFRFRIKFQNEQYLHNMSHYLFDVFIDTVNVVLDLKCIRLMNMLETINTYKADPASFVGSHFHNGRNYNLLPFLSYFIRYQ